MANNNPNTTVNLDLLINTAEAASSVREVRNAVRELNSAALQFGEGTAEFNRATAAAGNLARQLEDVNEQAAVDKAEGFNKLGKQLDSIKGKLLDLDFKGFGKEIAELGQVVTGLGPATTTAGTAFRGLAGAIAATGIGALIIAVTYLIANFDDLKKSTGLLGETIRSLTKWFAEFKEKALKGINDLVNGFIELYNSSVTVRGSIQGIILTFKTLVDGVVTGGKIIIDYFSAIGGAFIDIFKGKNPLDRLKEGFKNIKGDIKDFKDNFETNFNEAVNNTANSRLDKVDLFGKVIDDAKKNGKKAGKEFKDGAAEAIKQAEENFQTLEIFRTNQLEDSLQKRLLLFDLESLAQEERLRKAGATEAEITEFRNKQVLAITKKYNDEKAALQEKYNEEQRKKAQELTDNFQTAEIFRTNQLEDSLNKRLLLFDLNSLDEEEKLRKAGLTEIEITEWRNKEVAKITKDYNDEKIKEANETQQKIYEGIENTIAKITEGLRNTADLIGGFKGSILEAFANVGDSFNEAFKIFTDPDSNVFDKINSGLELASSAVSAIGDVLQAKSEENIAQYDKERDKKIAALEAQKAAGIITEQQLADGKTAINADYAKKDLAARKRAFNIQKGIQITNAVIQTAQAVLAGYSSGLAVPIVGPAVGAAYAAIAGALGAVQIGLIASQKFDSGDGGGSAGITVPAINDAAIAVPSQAAAATPNDFSVFGTGGDANKLGAQSDVTGANGGLRAYVVESDVTSTQTRVRRFEEGAEL